MREQRHPERPGVEVREVVGGEDVSPGRRAAARGPASAQRKTHLKHGVAEHSDEEIGPARAGILRTSAGPVSPASGHLRCATAVRYGDARTRPSAGEDPVIRPEKGTRGRTSSRDRRVSRQGEDHRRLPRRRLRRGVVDRPHPRPAEPRRRHPGRGQEGAVGAARRQRRRRVPAPLRRRPRQEEEGRRAEARAEELHRAPARDGRGPRGRGDRLAPARGAQAEGSRSSGWCSTRSPARRSSARSARPARSTTASSTRRRPGASSTGSTATRCRPSSGRR